MNIQEPITEVVNPHEYFKLAKVIDSRVCALTLKGIIATDYVSEYDESSNGLNIEETNKIISLLDYREVEKGTITQYKRSNSADHFVCLVKSICVGGECLGTVLIAVRNDNAIVPTVSVEIVDAIERLIVKEIQSNNELNAAAMELTDRYEELNLIYGTEESSDQYDKGRSVLSSLLIQCSERMNVDGCILYLPDQNLFLIEGGGDLKQSILTSENFAKYSLLPWADSAGQASVINDTYELQERLATTEVDCKIINSPILGYSANACGFVAVFNNVKRSDFTNSDRNLLEIISRKATRIVRNHYDELTGLTSKASFENYLEDVIVRMSDNENCLLFIDLRGIHVFNDTAGHDAGDALIKSVASALSDTVADDAYLARYDGDVFSILLCNMGLDECVDHANILMNAVNALDFNWGEHSFHTNVCMGLVPVLADATVENVTASANLAMRVACDKGNNLIEVQRPDNDDISNRKKRNRMLNTINDALKYNRFELFCQGIYDIKNVNEPHHYEVLLRMIGKNGEHISPFFFIPAAEYYKIMPDIDRWVVHETLQMLDRNWDVLESKNQSWAINLSGQTFTKPGFIEFISSELSAVRVDPRRVAFEVTETVAVDNLLTARKAIDDVKALGCEFYLDDFGTGLSSFTYLQELPFDHVKIDGSFIKNVVEDPVARAMVKAISDVAHVLGMKTVAEYVENHQIIRELQKLGVEYLQGYGLHKPTSMATVIECMRAQHKISA